MQIELLGIKWLPGIDLRIQSERVLSQWWDSYSINTQYIGLASHKFVCLQSLRFGIDLMQELTEE